MRSFLWRQQLADQAFFDAVEAEAETLAVRLRDGVPRAARPGADRDVLDQVYAEPHPLVEEERAEFAAYLASFEDEHAEGEPAMSETVTLARALNLGLRRAMEDDDQVVLMGEDIGKLGGVFRVTDALQKDFGEHRVIDSPLAESGIVGAASGSRCAATGPVVEIQFDGFVYPAFDQIVSQVAKMHARSRRRPADADGHPHPVRRRHRRGRAPQREPRGVLRAHRRAARGVAVQPGRRLLDDPAGDPLRTTRSSSSSPSAATGRRPSSTSTADARPALRRRGWLGRVATSRSPATDRWCVPASMPRCGRGREGVEVEVIDLRTLSPLDIDLVCASVERTGRLVVAHEATVFLGIGAEVAARVTERCFYSLEAPVLRVGGFHSPYPPSRLEEHYLPDLDRVLDAVDRSLALLTWPGTSSSASPTSARA